MSVTTEDPIVTAEIDRAKGLIEANRALIQEIADDRPREDAETERARALLRKAQSLINRAALVEKF